MSDYLRAKRFILPVIKNNENSTLCASCQHCCNSVPGLFAPADFGIKRIEMREHIVKGLLSLQYKIDYWHGDVHPNGRLDAVMYIRPATVDDPNDGRFMVAGWGGRCRLLGPDGCTLKFDARPYECRDLVPREHLNCSNNHGFMTKKLLLVKWRPYQKLLKSILDELEMVKV